jgi:hypothetical protein
LAPIAAPEKINIFWSVCVSLRYRALAKDRFEGLAWFWIGSHERYEQMLKQQA